MDEKPCSLLSRCQGLEGICCLCRQSWSCNLKRKTGRYSEKMVLICHITCCYILEDIFQILILTTLRMPHFI